MVREASRARPHWVVQAVGGVWFCTRYHGRVIWCEVPLITWDPCPFQAFWHLGVAAQEHPPRPHSSPALPSPPSAMFLVFFLCCGHLQQCPGEFLQVSSAVPCVLWDVTLSPVLPQSASHPCARARAWPCPGVAFNA